LASVRFEHVTKRYGQVTAVEDLNLDIPDGQFMTLVGPSGCGKSTTLNMLAGLEAVTEGDIYLDGDRITRMAPGDRDIAMVFQSYALYPHMSVRDNLGFALKIRDEPRQTIIERVDRAANMLGITELLGRKPRQLSGGQRQRVALGRALVREPRLFLLDEPLSNLDAKLRVQMRAELKLLFERLATTVVYVTHDQAEAMTLSDRVAIFNHGVVQQIGEPLELYDHPRNMFVAGFLGSPPMNLLEGEVNGDGAEIRGSGFSVSVAGQGLAISRGQRVVVGIRPEDVVIGDPDAMAVRSNVTLVEPMGSATVLYAPVGERLVTIETDKETRFIAGAPVGITLPPERLHVFDAGSEESLRQE
jgi:multiple sugar transport system ATP-binding protein